MISPKRPKLTKAQEREAYDIATLRDEECVRCRRGIPNRHHRQGRTPQNSIPSNLILLCGSGTTGCHGHVHANPAEAMRLGYIVSNYVAVDRIKEVPVLLWRRIDGIVMRRTWALLDDCGAVTWIGPHEAERRMREVGVAAADRGEEF